MVAKTEAQKARKKVYDAKYRADNLDKRKAYRDKYYIANSIKIKEAVAKYRANNPEKIKESSAKYRVNNPEKVRGWRNKYYASNINRERGKNSIRDMLKGTNLKASELPQELIDLRLKQVQMKRVMYANS